MFSCSLNISLVFVPTHNQTRSHPTSSFFLFLGGGVRGGAVFLFVCILGATHESRLIACQEYEVRSQCYKGQQRIKSSLVAIISAIMKLSLCVYYLFTRHIFSFFSCQLTLNILTRKNNLPPPQFLFVV
jgi:hypothetical protein